MLGDKPYFFGDEPTNVSYNLEKSPLLSCAYHLLSFCWLNLLFIALYVSCKVR